MSIKLFVFSTGRSGTHTISKLFSKIPNTLSIHEGRGNFNGNYIDVGDMKSFNIIYRKKVLEEKSNEINLQEKKIINLNFCKRYNLIKRLDKEGINFVDVNRMSYRYIKYIMDQYPEAKFLHIIRNGYDCIRSWYSRIGIYPIFTRRYIYKYTRYLYHNYVNNNKDTIINNLKNILNFIPYNMSRYTNINRDVIKILNSNLNLFYIFEKPIPNKNSKYYNLWCEFNRIEKIAWFWVYVNNKIEENFKYIPDDKKMTLKIEDLNKKSLNRISNFCGIKNRFKIKKIPKADKKYHSLKWSRDKIDSVNKIASNCLEKYNYKIRS